MITVEDDASALLERLAAYQPPSTPKWLERSET
jgi:hypothetical protein